METKNLLNKKITQWLLLVAMLVGCSANAFADGGTGPMGVYLNVNGTKKWYNVYSEDWGYTGCTNWQFNSATSFSGANLGTVTTLKLCGIGVVGWCTNGDFVAGQIGYKIDSGGDNWYKVGGYGEGCSASQVQCSKDNDRVVGYKSAESGSDQPVDLLSALSVGSHTLKITPYSQNRYNCGSFNDKTRSTVSATFTVPGFTTTSTSKDFGEVEVNGSSSATISFGNHYGTKLTTSNCSFSASVGFTVTSISETGVTVQFQPTSTGDKSATLTIKDAHNKTCTITLTGKGIVSCTPPTAYKVSGPASVCAGSNAEITLSNSQTGYTYELYKDGVATSDTKAGTTGSALTFTAKVSGSNAAAFTIKGYVTGTPTCTADMNGTATVTPIALPSAPTGSNINVCSGSDAVFTASQTNNRCIDWYTASTSGTKLATCQTSYTKTNLTSDYTVYVEARNADNGCVSQSRTAIKATAVAKPTIASTAPASGCIGTNVNIGATASSGATVRWYEASTGGTALYTGTPYTVSSISATKTYYAEAYNSTLDCASTSRTGVTATAKALNNVSNITFYPASIKKGETTTATATVTTDGGTGAWSTSTPSLISFSSTSDNPTTINANGIGTAKVTYTLTGGCSGTNSKTVDLVINSDCDAPNAGTISGTTAICAGGSVSLSVTGYTSTNTTLQWNKNGSPVAGKTSNTYTESNVTESATYTVTVTRTDVDNCSKTTDAGYEVTVTQIPSIATHTDGSRCGAGTVELQATASAGDVKWYSASTGGTALKTGTSYTTPSISATTKYYVDATQNGCTTASRTAVTATVNTVPSISSIAASTEDSGCGAGTVKFTASGVSASSTVHWYESSTKKGEGNTYNYNDVAAGSSVTLKAKAVHTNGCESEFTDTTTGTRKALPSLTTAPAGSAVTAYLWEPVNLTATTTDGTATVAISTSSTKYEVTDITNGKSLKAGKENDTFTVTYTATSTNGCQTQEVKTVTAAKATEDCSK